MAEYNREESNNNINHHRHVTRLSCIWYSTSIKSRSRKQTMNVNDYSNLNDYIKACDEAEETSKRTILAKASCLLYRFAEEATPHPSGKVARFKVGETRDWQSKVLTVFVRKDGDVFVDFGLGYIYQVETLEPNLWPDNVQEALVLFWNM